MKYVEHQGLDALTSFLTDKELGIVMLNGRIEAYSFQRKDRHGSSDSLKALGAAAEAGPAASVESIFNETKLGGNRADAPQLLHVIREAGAATSLGHQPGTAPRTVLAASAHATAHAPSSSSSSSSSYFPTEAGGGGSSSSSSSDPSSAEPQQLAGGGGSSSSIGSSSGSSSSSSSGGGGGGGVVPMPLRRRAGSLSSAGKAARKPLRRRSNSLGEFNEPSTKVSLWLDGCAKYIYV